MPFHTNIFYPNEPDTKFDLDYYVNTHMKMVTDKLTKFGLKKWDVVEYKPGADGAKPAYVVGVTMVWDTPDQMATAFGSDDAKPVFADVPNFTNKQPVIFAGPVAGTS